MSNIVIPIAGDARRFVDAGFTAPKPLIMVNDRHMIDWALDSIKHEGHQLIFIVRQAHINSFSIDSVLRDKFGDDIIVIAVDQLTRGTLCTCLLAEEHIDNEEPLIIYTPDVCFGERFDPDTFTDDGLILTFKANSPAHSYASINEEGHVIETAEKKVIGENAAVGVYCFKHGEDFVTYAKEMIASEITTNGEFYVCPIYNLLIRDGYTVTITPVQQMHVLGTPEDLEFFHNHVLPRFGSKPIALCADHSGLDLKSRMKSRLEHHNIPYIDFGTYSTSDCDHHDFLSQVVRHIHEGMCDFGMAFCRTGQGFNIAANKARGIRSALVFDDYTARMSVHHNAANMFCLPSKYVDSDETADRIIAALFVSSFDGGRHATRIRKIEEDTELFG